MIQMKNSRHSWSEIGELLNLTAEQARNAVKVAYPEMKFPHARSKKEEPIEEEPKAPPPPLFQSSWIKPPTKEQLMAGNARIAKVED